MKIKTVRIENFRCLEDTLIKFDSITTFVGPNGAGKSTVLRALDWFFNGTKTSQLAVEDAYLSDPDRTVAVTVEFDSLRDDDRARLGTYGSGEGNLTVRKQWHDGAEKIVGRALIYGSFAQIRSGANAAEKKTAYRALSEAEPELGMPNWSNQGAADEWMTSWEADNPDRLTVADMDSASHFFGFHGQAMMSGLFDFIFVSADMRAGEEASDNRGAIVGRILEQALDRSAADSEFNKLYAGLTAEQDKIHAESFGSQLAELSEELTSSVAAFAPGRKVTLVAELPELIAPKAQFKTVVTDLKHDSSVERQGHGFQRVLIIAALKLLADKGASESNGVICLAIEEPELYQHPQQARAFAAVLRDLAEQEPNSTQIAYATHSPYFVEARSFHQIRRVTKQLKGNDFRVCIEGSNIDNIVSRLDGFVTEQSARKQLDGVCLGAFAEAFFADSALIVEGTTDRAILSGVAARSSKNLLQTGVFIGEAGGKTGVLLPYVILDELGIPAFILADNDSHLVDRIAEAESSDSISGDDQKKIAKWKKSLQDEIAWNKKLLRFFDLDEEDFPAGPVTPNLTFTDGGLEEALARDWPEWGTKRTELVAEGLGYEGKNSATYELAARDATGEPPEVIVAVLSAADGLRIAA